MAEVGIRGHRLLALHDAGVCRDNRWGLRGEADALAERGLRGVVGGVRIKRRMRRNGSAKNVHGVGILGEPDDLQHPVGNGAVGAKFGVKGLEFASIGQLAVKQQVDRLFERCHLGQIVDGVPAVEKLTFDTVYEAGLGLVYVYALQSPFELYLRGHCAPLGRSDKVSPRLPDTVRT